MTKKTTSRATSDTKNIITQDSGSFRLLAPATLIATIALLGTVALCIIVVNIPEVSTKILPFIPTSLFTTLVSILGIVISIGIVFSFRSIQKKSRANTQVIERLQETRDRYAEALEGSGLGTWERTFPDGTVYMSEHWCSLFGYTEADAPKTNTALIALAHEDDRPIIEQMLRHSVDGGMHFYKAEYRLRTGAGDWRYVIDEGAVEHDSMDRTKVRITGSTRDITALHDAEEILKHRTNELREANTRIQEEILNTRKFAQAVAASGDAIVITDTEGYIVYANDAWRVLTGISPETAIGTHLLSPFEEKSSATVIRAIRYAIKTSERYTTDELSGTHPNKTNYDAELSLFPVIEQGKATVHTAIIIDVTTRKAVDKAKTEFVSLASHQLRTPLSAIRWYAEMLLSDMSMPLEKDQHTYVQEIYDANKRMIELVDALLNVSRLDLGTMQWIAQEQNITEIVTTAIKELEPLSTRKHIEIATSFAPDIKPIMFDHGQLHIIFQNLLSNAVKYTQEGGFVEVVVHMEGTDRIFFSVKDNGYGIPVEQQANIFNKMFRADNAKAVDASGTGLGLYIIKNIIEHAGGSIRFESALAKGTTFYGILPIQASAKSDI